MKKNASATTNETSAITSQASTVDIELVAGTTAKLSPLPAHLSEKFYRQALFFYFQDQPIEALNQLKTNHERFAETSMHESLFRVGLQISQGLHSDAQALLTQLASTASVSKKGVSDESEKSLISTASPITSHNMVNRHAKKDELTSTVLLQLAEQKIIEQDLSGAQRILANIKSLPAHNFTQYYLLQQLISWPEQPPITSFSLGAETQAALLSMIRSPKHRLNTTPYILLNEALSALTLKEHGIAEEKLKQVNAFKWKNNTLTFWQQIFDEYLRDYFISAKLLSESRDYEKQGVRSYAKLLLSQLYIEQNKHEQAYALLANFPKSTAFSEQAMFLFGYAAFKLKKYDAANIILKEQVAQYPYGEFTQQALALSAAQFSAKHELNNALNRYLTIEAYYQNLQLQLDEFSATIEQQNNFLPFFREVQPQTIKNPTALWLNLSLKSGELGTFYYQLNTVDELSQQLQAQQLKNQWLKQTIALNHQRQNGIRESQSTQQSEQLLKALLAKREHLSALLTQAKQAADGELFADEIEKKLLSRVENSQQALATINNSPAYQSKKKQRSVVAYQKRLARIEGVLAWKLEQQMPDRFWNVQHALNQFDHIYENTNTQHDKVSSLLSQQSILAKVSRKNALIADKISVLLADTQQLKERLQQNVFAQTKTFVADEHEKLKQYILFNQRAMAIVIEKLNLQEALNDD